MLLALLNPSPTTMRIVRVASSALPLLLPVALVRSVDLGEQTGMADAFAWLPLLVYFGITTGLDYLIGMDTTNDPPTSRFMSHWFRALPVAAACVYAVTLTWAMSVFVEAPFTWVGQLGWALSMGTVAGTLAINVAHELIHKPTRIEQWIGGALLSSVGYATFKIEHVHGHHVWVATERDPSTARRGEGVYTYLSRAIAQNIGNAWRLQARRLARDNARFWSIRNELLGWTLLSIAIGFASLAAFGAAGLVFFLAQAVGAIVHLEIINYIEHYGLERACDQQGRHEKVTVLHSWNSAYFLSNAYLFQLQRHSDHHAHAGRAYNNLQHVENAPQLPGGYAAMILLALVPTAWRAVIDPRIPR
jgi:alkane 1-monooxygenase